MQRNKVHGPGKDPVQKLGRKSLQPVITVNTKFSKIYFSRKAVDLFNLEKKQFVIFEEDGSWFFSLSSKPRSLKLKLHQGAFYTVKRSLVRAMVKSFESAKIFKLLIEGSETESPKYLLTLVEGDKRDYFKGNLDPELPVVKKVIGKEMRAVILLNSYRQTEFKGRIKTVEVMQAEQFLNSLPRRIK